jgi:peptidoglycan/LPS O-acetylase OafA/YrhL
MIHEGGRGPALLSRLSRRTSGGRWIPEIDGLRFVAIAVVLLSHVVIASNLGAGRVVVQPPFGSGSSPGHLDPFLAIAAHGTTGVLLFFVVSGFVLALPFIRNRRAGNAPLPLWPYFRRRIMRIEPPYLLVITALFIGATLAGAHVGWGRYLASITYMYGTYYGTDSILNSVAWSLEVEVQFYVLVPALALLLCVGLRKSRRMKIVGLALFASACNASGVMVAYPSVFTTIQYFLLGWLLADIYVEDWGETPLAAPAWDVVGALALVAMFGIALLPANLFRAVAPWVLFLVCCAAFRSVGLRRALSNRWIATIGGMCYSIYLVHYPLFVLLGRHLPLADVQPDVACVIAAVVLVPAALFASAVFFVLVERPTMDPAWPGRLRRAIASRPAADEVVVIPEVDEVVVREPATPM